MRHRKLSGRLGRTGTHRRAMFRNMVTALLDHERIETTDAKARQVRRLAERMITLGKRGTLHARRRALRVVRSKDVTAKLFTDLADRYRERPGGYTRVVKVRQRVGDAAPLSIVELVEGAVSAAPVAEGRRRRGRAKAEDAAQAEAPSAGRRRLRRGKAAATADEPKKREVRSGRRSRAKAAESEKGGEQPAVAATRTRRAKKDSSKASTRKKRS